MLSLYYKPTCVFSQRVIGEAERLGIRMDLKDISVDPVLESELMEKGGKDQTPFLVDTERGEQMYESNDIIMYLEEHYGVGEKTLNDHGGLRIHKNDDICESCQ
jgi:glutathione S-transferase